MEENLVAAVSALVGLLVGVFSVVAFRVSERERKIPEAATTTPALPAGVADVLAVLRSSTVVLDAGEQVVRASPSAYAYGIVRDGRIVVDHLLEVARLVRRDGEIRETDLDLPRGPLGGGTVSVLVRIAPLGSSAVLLLVEDRTEALRVDAVRRDFVANVSHELKTPVGAVALLSEAMIDAAADPAAVVRFAGRMQHEATRLSQLVQDIIDLSRLQGHDPLQSPQVVCLDEVVMEAVDRSRLAAETKDVTVVVGGARGLCVSGDGRQLGMALGNLVDNAVRHSPAGTRVGVALRLASADRSHAGGIVEISVSDEGDGIPREEIDRVFERFYRVDAARSRDTGGTGLGLAIAKHVAVGHGGEVTVWSVEGSGSTFTLRLPGAVPAERERV